MAYPILAAQSTWWKPNISSVTRTTITEIEIMDNYTPDSSVTVVDSWDASAAQDGSITCYVIGTKLIMAGNGSGKIAANEDSYACFCDIDTFVGFTAMTTLSGTSYFDMSGVSTMKGMFFRCEALESIDVSSWDVSNVTAMNLVFSRCYSLVSVEGINKWNTSNVTDMSQMFLYDSALTSIDLSDWDMPKVTTLFSMFLGCNALVSVKGMSNWNVPMVTNMSGMFQHCYNLVDVGDLSKWNTSSLTTTFAMFYECSSLRTIGDIGKWNMSNVENMQTMFQNCSKLTDIGDLANWDVSNVTNMSFMFYGCSSLGEIDVSNWDVSKVTTLDHFAAHAGLRRIGIENWNTSSLVNANAAFHNCAEEELDLSGWDVSKVQIFSQMFENSPNLKRIKGLENWNTSAGLDFSGMFERCYVLEELDLSSFDTSKAKNGVVNSGNNGTSATLQNMFLSCNNLKKVTVGPNFSINGDGTNTAAANKAILPTPSTDYIEGADGMWYNFTGESFAPNAMKDKTAETYYASYDIVADMDVICKNGSLIDTAKAIREKNGTTDQYTPAQFGAAIRALS